MLSILIHTEKNNFSSLCQIGHKVSCSACCGLYNLSDISKDELSKILLRRSIEFAGVSRTADAIDHFRITEEEKLKYLWPSDDFHHCVFIGMIGEHFDRAGCLLHPKSHGNHGVDFRGFSYYGSLVCHIYLCPSHRLLPQNWKAIISGAAQDWYEYGLLITEFELLHLLFTEIEKGLGRPLRDTDLSKNSKTFNSFRRVLNLKINWPHRPAGSHITHYFFNDALYEKPEVEYPTSIKSHSRYHGIFKELKSSFPTLKTLMLAEKSIESILSSLVSEIRCASG